MRAKGRELLAHVLEIALRREPATDRREARHQGSDRTVGQRVQELLVADVLDFVVIELPQRAADDRALLGL